jgi:hypothetical protein
MAKLTPPVNSRSDENTQTIPGTKSEDSSNHRTDHNSTSQTDEEVVSDLLSGSVTGNLRVRLQPFLTWCNEKQFGKCFISIFCQFIDQNESVHPLERQNDGYAPKKSSVLTKEQVDRFLNFAPDNKYLMMKVCL